MYVFSDKFYVLKKTHCRILKTEEKLNKKLKL